MHRTEECGHLTGSAEPHNVHFPSLHELSARRTRRLPTPLTDLSGGLAQLHSEPAIPAPITLSKRVPPSPPLILLMLLRVLVIHNLHAYHSHTEVLTLPVLYSRPTLPLLNSKASHTAEDLSHPSGTTECVRESPRFLFYFIF